MCSFTGVSVEEGRRRLWVQGSCSSLGHLLYGMLGEDKADGSSLLLCWRLSASSLLPSYLPPLRLPHFTPLSRLQAQKRGAILRDQNEAGTDNLV